MKLFEYIDVLSTPYAIYEERVSGEDFCVKPHWHYYTEILFVTNGRIFVKCSDTTLRMGEGDLIIIAKKTIHSIDHDSVFPAAYTVIKFDLNTLGIPHAYLPSLRKLLDSGQDGWHFFTTEKLAGNEISALTGCCLSEADERKFGYDLSVRATLSLMLVRLSRIIMSMTPDGEEGAAEAPDSFFDRILEYIDEHSDERLEVSALAERCGMSYSNFAKQFRQSYGRTCREYIEYIRVIKAEEMLFYGGYDLSRIALETGFTDCSHFIRTYKKFRGITPNRARASLL